MQKQMMSFQKGGPWLQARNFAVFSGVNAGLSTGMRRWRKKEDVRNTCALSSVPCTWPRPEVSGNKMLRLQAGRRFWRRLRLRLPQRYGRHAAGSLQQRRDHGPRAGRLLQGKCRLVVRLEQRCRGFSLCHMQVGQQFTKARAPDTDPQYARTRALLASLGYSVPLAAALS